MESRHLNILILEDRASDAELVLHELRRARFVYQWHRVETEAEFLRWLSEDIDIIIADYTLPQFDAPRALRLLQDSGKDIPFIVLTGTVSEEVAVQVMKLGASDYLLKDRLARLGPAIMQALDQKKLRDAKREADETLQQYAANLEQLVAERTAELRRTKERVEAVLNHTSDAIILATFDGVIQQTNPAFTELTGEKAEDVFGQSLIMLAEPGSIDPLIEAMRQVVQKSTPQRVELRLRRKDGSVFDADVGLAAIREENKTQDIVCSLMDISERKRIENNLRAALEKERQLNELKTRFTSMISHEFRTPLAIIRASSDILRLYEERLDKRARAEKHRQIEEQIDRLTGLLEDILFLSRADAVGIEFNPAMINAQSFFSSLLEDAQLVAQTHRFHLIASDLCQQICIDANLLREAMTNLLSNAIKYSPPESNVYLHVRCEGDNLNIEVKDEGRGIPLADQEHLFEPFHRASNVGMIQGTGLGLSIVKRAVEAHGGAIAVESVEGSGSTFIITIPQNSD